MKKISMFPAFVALLAMSAAPLVLAQETTVQFGRYGNTPSAPLNVSGVSTGQVDPWLYYLNPSRFGAHYTRDVANGMFADIDALEGSVQAALLPIIQEELGSYLVGTPTITVNTNPLHLDLWQTNAGLRAQVYGLSVSVAARADLPGWEFCDTVSARFGLTNINVGGEYSIATGRLQNTAVHYTVGDVHVNCSGLFSSFLNLLIDAFGEGWAQAEIKEKLREKLTEELAMLDSRTIFSVHDFLEGFRNVIGYPPLNALANEVITLGQGIVANPGSLNRSVGLSVTTSQATSGNLVSFIVWHSSPAHVEMLDYHGLHTVITVSPGENSNRTDVFYRYPAYTGPWYLLGSTTTGVLDVLGSYPIGTEIGAVAVNQHHPSLRAGLGITRPTEYSAICTRNCTPQEPE